MSPARRVAYTVLQATNAGGFASDLLRHHAASLSRPDAALATELVMGVLRYRPQLDFAILSFGRRQPAQLDPPVLDALRLGIYQLRYLDRIPRHAAVHESVSLVKAARLVSAAGLVNAILRQVDRRPLVWPSRSIELCLPEWLLLRWIDHFGPERAQMIARTMLQPPEHYIRIPPTALETTTLPPSVEPTNLPGAFRIRNEADLSGFPFRTQDIGSQSIVPLLEIEPGMRVLDVCAAPGNKTAQILEATQSIVACDANLSRLRGLRSLGCPLVVADASSALPFPRSFDRILADAPCSGTGTIRRNPEIKWRVKFDDLAVHQARQARILREVLGLLKPGGRLVYSTCSLEPEENEQVVALMERRGAKVLKVLRRTPGEEPGDGFFAAVLTSEASA